MNAVPAEQQDDARAVAELLPPGPFPPSRSFAVRVNAEIVAIPYRIFHPEPDPAHLSGLSAPQRVILSCLYTRHHDGLVRQRHLRNVVGEARAWVAPFVVQLIGEYVVQILVDIRDGLVGLDTPGTPTHAVYGEFGAANPRYVTLTRQRVSSYWNCYHRHLWPDRARYPGFVTMESLCAAARSYQP